MKRNERAGSRSEKPLAPRKSKDEMKITGVNSCLAFFNKRPQDLVRAYLTKENIPKITPVLKYCAQNKISYRIVEPEEMTAITDSSHHEDICFLIKTKQNKSLPEIIAAQNEQKSSCYLILDRVENPHNLGAIVRVAANFGASTLILHRCAAVTNSAVYRTAEGGMEWINVVESDDLSQDIALLKKKGVRIFSTSSHVGHSLREELPLKHVAFLLGSEGFGLSKDRMKEGHGMIRIPSTGHVESLNVACAASVLLYEYYCGVITASQKAKG